MSQKQPKNLSNSISDKFKMAAGFAPGKYVHGNLTIDTSICSLAQAEAFIAEGSKILEPVPAKETVSNAKK